jgi:hypothetical protein
VSTAGTARQRDRRPSTQLTFSIARETAVRDEAFRLVHEQYMWRGFMTAAHASGRRVNLRHALPTTRMFVAQDGTRVVGTATVFQDSPLGLPMDEVFADQLAAMRQRGRRIAEVSALAMDGDRRAYGLPALMQMLRLVLVYAASVAHLDDLCLVVRPQHAQFYKQLGACRVMGEPRDYDKVNLPGAVALHIDLHEMRAMIKAIRAGRPAMNRIQAFVAGPGFEEVVAQLEREAPNAALTTEQFAEFIAIGDVLAQATDADREYVQSLYRRPAHTRTATAARMAPRPELAAA